MTDATSIETIARTYLRDFPKFFQTSFDSVGRSFELEHINIDASTLWVATNTMGSASVSVLNPTDYSLDVRNGILRLNTSPNNARLLVEGYYYEWVTPEDLSFYCQRSIGQTLSNLPYTLGQISSPVADVIGIGALIEVLWALLTEYSRDIDVMTSESIHIPASQRFRMVQSLLATWEAQYEKKAKALNIGLDRIEVFSLRRLSRTTNRLVPLYRSKELGDYGPYERLFPPIDSGILNVETPEEPLRQDVFIDGAPPEGYVTGVVF
jgi:hypothetical protein